MFCDSFASYVWESECVKCFLRDCACCPYKAEAWLYRYSAVCRFNVRFIYVGAYSFSGAARGGFGPAKVFRIHARSSSRKK